MLSNLGSIGFLGDLSLEDADVLAYHARRSRCVLEFGAGGSTQIMSQCGIQHLDSIETVPGWITITQSRLDRIPDHAPVRFLDYTTQFDREYDLVFVDGVWARRYEFACAAWAHLSDHGVMIFHDTRRDFDFANAADVAKTFFLEIQRIDVNVQASNGRSSNMTVLHKKPREPYVNWNDTEGKPAWTYGVPDGEDHPLWRQDAAT